MCIWWNYKGGYDRGGSSLKGRWEGRIMDYIWDLSRSGDYFWIGYGQVKKEQWGYESIVEEQDKQEQSIVTRHVSILQWNPFLCCVKKMMPIWCMLTGLNKIKLKPHLNFDAPANSEKGLLVLWSVIWCSEGLVNDWLWLHG